MPEYRQDLITGQWVIIATDRAKRPETFACKTAGEIDHASLPGFDGRCPFCYGNEDKTPPEVLSLDRWGGRAEAQRWQVRVVPNKYPAVEPEGAAAAPRAEEGLFSHIPGYGRHEVIIETPEHNRHPGTFAQEEMRLVIEAYRRRFVDLAADPRLRSVQIFRNHGREAGASIQHPHSQLMALPFIPSLLMEELEGAHRYFLQRENCPYCDLLSQERRCGERMVAENDLFSAYVPYAARLPFETWVVPRRHQSSFQEIEEREIDSLAEIMCGVLGKLSRSLDDPPYNYFLHSAPLRATGLPHYHWHLELVPKLTTVAGFELGSGVYINVTLPEEAAGFLRERGEDDEWRRKNVSCPGLAQSPTRG